MGEIFARKKDYSRSINEKMKVWALAHSWRLFPFLQEINGIQFYLRMDLLLETLLGKGLGSLCSMIEDQEMESSQLLY